MNILKHDKQVAAINAIVEGCSVRSTERLTGVHRDTILRLVNRVGEACARIMDEKFRFLDCESLQVDELWTYVAKHQRRLVQGDDQSRAGDFYIWVGIDPRTKLVLSHHVGKRTHADCSTFVQDISKRVLNRVQISSDSLTHYAGAIVDAFDGKVDYATVVKSYEAEPMGQGRYSPPRVTSVKRTSRWGNPRQDRISTSLVERQNLTMRMACRRLTRLTNAYSRKPENLKAAIALHFGHYNLVRPHTTLQGATPAVAAGVTSKAWTISDLVASAA